MFATEKPDRQKKLIRVFHDCSLHLSLSELLVRMCD